MNIQPISELKNYNTLLEEVKDDEPMYLTKNGKGVYVIFTINEAENFQEYKAFKKSVDDIALHDRQFFFRDVKELEQKLVISLKKSNKEKKSISHNDFWSSLITDYENK